MRGAPTRLLRVAVVAVAALAAARAAGGCADATDRPVPGDGFAPGWTRAGETRHFPGQNLYGHINGGAELFHELGFVELLVQDYRRGEDELALEVYRMTSPEAALGIYLAKTGEESPVDGVTARNTGGPHQLIVLQGSCFLQVNNFGGADALMPAMVALARGALAAIPAVAPAPLLEVLPATEGGAALVPGSEQLVRGPFGLEPIYTFGEGDILRLGGEVFAAVGDYRDAAGDRHTRIAVRYGDASRARATYDHLVAGLDPYLEIVRCADDGFVFRDHGGRYGSVRLADDLLTLRVHLAAEPLSPACQSP
jgi:hypothetical protein